MSVATGATLPATLGKPPSAWFEFTFGILMPILCFVADHSIMNISRVAPLALWGVAALGIFALLLSHVSTSHAVRHVTLGMLTAAGFMALLIGIALLPLSLIGIIAFGIGLLGLVPFLTAAVFYNRVVWLKKSAETDTTSLFYVAGVVMLLGLPMSAQYIEYRWISAQTAMVMGTDNQKRISALRALQEYPLNLGRTDIIACSYFNFADNVDPQALRELEMIMGPDIEARCKAAID